MKRALPALLLLFTLAACSDPPGKLIGAYGVTMKLQSNSCGASGLPLADGYRYTAELRADGEHGYWRVPKVTPIDGTYDPSNGTFAFSYQNVFDLGSADAGTSGCTFLRNEDLYGQIALPAPSDGGVEVIADAAAYDAGLGTDGGPSLVATHTISFSPNPAGTCANVTSAIGPFANMPCSASYELVGTPHKAF